jgi:putative intracellular protease/amidase
MKVLIVVTSVSRLDDLHPTGVWLEEYAIPFTALIEAGVETVVASPKGGPAPIDPKSGKHPSADILWRASLEALAYTRPLSEISLDGFDGVFFPGGHGPMIDLAGDADLKRLVGRFAETGRVIAAVCHGPAALLGATAPDGAPLVAKRKVTGFTNGEEALSGVQAQLPFCLETRLIAEGALFEHAVLPFAGHVVRDGWLITGQNPASSEGVARCLIEALGERQRAELLHQPGPSV